MPELRRILTALDRAPDQPAALATLVAIEGSSYRRPGARLLLLPDGTRLGSISGGCLEDDITARAERVLASGQPEVAVYDTTEENDLVWGVGTGCHGVVRVFLERIPAARPDWIARVQRNLHERQTTSLVVDYAGKSAAGTQLDAAKNAVPESGQFRETIEAPAALVLCGAGDDAQPLCRMAHAAGWHVTVIDARPGYATRERFSRADRILCGPLTEILPALSIDQRTYAVVMSHRYRDDLEFLRSLLPREFPYLGQLGPRSRTQRLLDQLAREGSTITEEYRAKFHSPVGLDLGGSDPESVAVAILAEVQACLNGRAGGALRNRSGPIHG